MYNRCAVEGLALKTMESTIKTICLGLVRYFQKRPSNSHRNLWQSLPYSSFPGTTARISSSSIPVLQLTAKIYLVTKTVSTLFNFIDWIPLQFLKKQTNKRKTKMYTYILGLTLFALALRTIRLHQNCTIYNF